RKSNTMPTATEDQECMAFIDWTKLVTFAGEPLWHRVVKIPNDRESRSVKTAILTALGMRKGFPDYEILAPCGRYHGLFIEAKRRKGGAIEDDQRVWRDRLISWGYKADICAGSIEMIATVREYFREGQAAEAGLWIDRTRGQV